MDSDVLVLEGLRAVGGLTAADDVGDTVALQFCHVEGQGRVSGAVEDEEANVLGHGRLDQGELLAQGDQAGAAGRGGQTLQAGGGGVDGNRHDGAVRGHGSEHADRHSASGRDGAHCSCFSG